MVLDFNVQTYVWSLFKASKTQKNFSASLFFLATGNKQFQQANAQPYAYDANKSTRRLVKDRMDTGLTSTHTARGFSVLYHVFPRKQCILCTFFFVTLHFYMLHQFEIFSTPGTTTHGSIRLPPRSLAKTRGCSLAIIIQLLLWKGEVKPLFSTF